MGFSESDWKHFSRLKPLALDQQRLLTEEEFAGFSAETRNVVDSWLSRNA